ncbi:MAG: hypothetical protein GY862_20855 [Gammaproteobacteria bacterium]|nr:hypothetical protein [Gammaproteobacteria bacterium]
MQNPGNVPGFRFASSGLLAASRGGKIYEWVPVTGENGAVIFRETIDDAKRNRAPLLPPFHPQIEARVVLHETGHQFGLAHPIDNPNRKTRRHIMEGANIVDNAAITFLSGDYFIEYDVNLLRSRINSPGEGP